MQPTVKQALSRTRVVQQNSGCRGVQASRCVASSALSVAICGHRQAFSFCSVSRRWSCSVVCSEAVHPSAVQPASVGSAACECRQSCAVGASAKLCRSDCGVRRSDPCKPGVQLLSQPDTRGERATCSVFAGRTVSYSIGTVVPDPRVSL